MKLTPMHNDKGEWWAVKPSHDFRPDELIRRIKNEHDL